MSRVGPVNAGPEGRRGRRQIEGHELRQERALGARPQPRIAGGPLQRARRLPVLSQATEQAPEGLVGPGGGVASRVFRTTNGKSRMMISFREKSASASAGVP